MLDKCCNVQPHVKLNKYVDLMSVFLSGVLCVYNDIVAAALSQLALAMLLHEARFAFDPSGLYLCVAAVCKFT